MGMRLLQKSDIYKAKAAEQRRDIDEGAKLARRIDNLREVAAQEEESLEKFRRETLSKIHDDIKNAQNNLNSLRREANDIRSELDTRANKIAKDEERLAHEKERLAIEVDESNSKALLVQNKENQVAKAIKQVSDALARISTRDDVSRANFRESSNANKEAKTILARATRIEDKILKWVGKKQTELEGRERQIKGHEKGLLIREDILKKEQGELAKGWILLRDRESMLERTIKRIKK